MYIQNYLNPCVHIYIYLNTANNISFGVIGTLHEEEVICIVFISTIITRLDTNTGIHRTYIEHMSWYLFIWSCNTDEK